MTRETFPNLPEKQPAGSGPYAKCGGIWSLRFPPIKNVKMTLAKKEQQTGNLHVYEILVNLTNMHGRDPFTPHDTLVQSLYYLQGKKIEIWHSNDNKQDSKEMRTVLTSI